ncbi:MAG: hypothetical protein CVV27_11180 [Candidatus Melainabacteria bacterium HGW-Melainabacteria-1]|nr:MAG: hypothetical protein CVV27_11180 [Candidatus Melainabacteria bacterium HGW-Melainabacteria-1]
MKHILILGGTQFVGRQLVEKLSLRDGLELTLFHRGKTNPGLFPELRTLQGDRDSDDIRLFNRRDWDAVIDFSGYYPRPLARLAQSLSGRCGRYLYVSSISAYDLSQVGKDPIKEDHPTLSWTPDEEIDRNMESYGKRKAACEQVLLQEPDFVPMIFRPGVIYGAHDPTDRLYYWIWRYQMRQRLLIPDTGARRTQLTYAADFAALLERALLEPLPANKLWHVLTHDPVPYADLLEHIAALSGRSAKAVRVSPAWMDEHDLSFWRDFPILLDQERLFDTALMHADFAPELTPLPMSLAQTAEFYAQLGWPVPVAGISPEREDQLLNLIDTANWLG